MAERPNIIEVGGTSQQRLLIHSHPGRGKTTIIGTSPNPARTLIIRPPQDSTDSIAGSGVQEVVVRTWAEFTDITAWLRMDGAELWDWVWLDSISLWQSVGLDDVWAAVLLKHPHRRMWGLDRGEYGVNMERIGQHLRDLIAVESFHIGVTAHSAQLTDTDGNVLSMPYVQGKNMSDQICGSMKTVAYLDFMSARSGKPEEERRRVLHFRGTDDYYAKDQFKAFPTGKMVDPTMPKIINAINAQIAKRGEGSGQKGAAKPTRRVVRKTGRK